MKEQYLFVALNFWEMLVLRFSRRLRGRATDFFVSIVGARRDPGRARVTTGATTGADAHDAPVLFPHGSRHQHSLKRISQRVRLHDPARFHVVRGAVVVPHHHHGVRSHVRHLREVPVQKAQQVFVVEGERLCMNHGKMP